MFRLASFEDVAKSINHLKLDNIFGHELFGSDEAVTVWDAVDQDWHLFSSDSLFIKTSIAHITTEIRHSNCDNDWNKDINILRSLHDDNHQ